MDYAWIESLRKQCPRVTARESLENQQPYTHRFFYELEEPAIDFLDVTGKEQQPLLRVISLSRLVKPTSIPYSNIWVRSDYNSAGAINHFSEPVINAYSVAYGLKEHEWNTITDADAAEMAHLWDAFIYFLNEELTYRRIVRAFKRFELAYAVYFAELRFPLFHSALESMICTTHHFNRAQVTQRLPQLVPFVSSQQASEIYSLCNEFKHEAAAILQESTENGRLSARDQARVDCVPLLHEAVRYLLLKALKERQFADTLADVEVLTKTYPAYSKGKLIVPKRDESD